MVISYRLWFLSTEKSTASRHRIRDSGITRMNGLMIVCFSFSGLSDLLLLVEYLALFWVRWFVWLEGLIFFWCLRYLYLSCLWPSVFISSFCGSWNLLWFIVDLSCPLELYDLFNFMIGVCWEVTIFRLTIFAGFIWGNLFIFVSTVLGLTMFFGLACILTTSGLSTIVSGIMFRDGGWRVDVWGDLLHCSDLRFCVLVIRFLISSNFSLLFGLY